MLDSIDSNIRELGRRLVIPKDWDQYYELCQEVMDTGLYANLGPKPEPEEEAMGTWYRSRDILSGDHPWGQHLLNKKWPLTKGTNILKLNL